jgi:aminoglycoside phosphotransferase (APT) family kinase protein
LEVDFSDEPLVMNHDDIELRNFLIDPETKQVTIIDFGHINVLPRSFVSHTLHHPRTDFIKKIASFLSWERSKNLSAMGAAGGIFGLMSGRALGTLHLCLMLDFELTTAIGLNEDGHPI